MLYASGTGLVGDRIPTGRFVMSGGEAMQLVITADTTRPELEEAITLLRRQQRITRLTSMRVRLGEQIDVLLEAWAAA